MEKLKRVVSEIAYTYTHHLSKLSLLHRSLIPLLSIFSSLYSLSNFTRHHLYSLGFLKKHRLPVAVISVGNITWGGNGKTPMVEFLSNWLFTCGISPLVLSRGYAGGDEVKMLERHLLGTSAKVGTGANRAMTAGLFLDKYGYYSTDVLVEKLIMVNKVDFDVTSNKIGATILDDGMQHLRLIRDLDIVMVNGLMPWGNNHLIPLGPLREPLSALARADIVVIHHADLVPEQDLRSLKFRIEEINDALPVFFSRMVPSHFFSIHNVRTKLPLSAVESKVVLCLSAIGSPISFIKCVEKLGPMHVDQLHYSDHYLFKIKDICMVRRKLEGLYHSFGSRPIMVTTEKDYDRDPGIFSQLLHFEVLVLCSRLQIVPRNGSSEKTFKELFKQLLFSKLREIPFHQHDPFP